MRVPSFTALRLLRGAPPLFFRLLFFRPVFSAIARLEEAETHRALAAAKIDVTRAAASPRPAARRVSATRNTPAYAPDDWRAYSDDDDEESTNNRGEWPE